MDQKSKNWTISVVRDTSGANENWIATIAEEPNFKANCASYEEGLAAILNYKRMIKELGHNPNQDLIAYFHDPSLENWIKCREIGLNPSIRRYGGQSWLGLSDNIIGKYGINQEMFIKLLDIDEKTISDVCIMCLKSIDNSNKLIKSGKTHISRRNLIIPFEVIDWIICCILDSFAWYGEEKIPEDLRMLIRFRLIPGNSRIEDQKNILISKKNATWVGRQLRAKGLKPTFRAVAKIMHLEPSTVKRWFKSVEEFQESVDRVPDIFKSDGSVKSLEEITAETKSVLHEK